MNDEIEKLNTKTLLLFGIIGIVLHSIYLVNINKKKIEGKEVLNEDELYYQYLLNRIAIAVIFFYFFISTYEEYKNDDESIIDVVITLLPLIAAILEIIITIKEKNQSEYVLYWFLFFLVFSWYP